MDSDQTLLLIADIGGYTEYMRSHRMSLAHAEVNTARLLEKVIDAARDFDLIEIEGDAAFLSRQADALDGDATVAAIDARPSSPCTARSTSSGSTSRPTCARARAATQANNLKLKFVAHIGEVATQTIRQRRKLVGIDVILVHRMLKNPVAGPRVRAALRGALPQPAARRCPIPCTRSPGLEGIGPVRAYFVDVADLPEPLPPPGRIPPLLDTASATRSAWPAAGCRTCWGCAGARRGVAGGPL